MAMEHMENKKVSSFKDRRELSQGEKMNSFTEAIDDSEDNSVTF